MILKTDNIREILEKEFIGKTAKADHPITDLNPTETFEIKHVDFEVLGNEIVVKVRGEQTCWFGKNVWSIVDV